MMPQTEKHRASDADCPCADCLIMRLTYALLVAKNHRDISPVDFDKGVMILSAYLTGESL